MIEYIHIDNIIPHPSNPRKDLGDLTELADSIRETGILQNLTVIPTTITETVSAPGRKSAIERSSGYMVIIGHRRLAAARLAGLTQVPCVITEMDERTQLATMLLENLQRSDLTRLEEAQGMQLMLDLGDTVVEVAKRTGLSESTIRRRTKWVQMFGVDKLIGLQERNISFEDYEKLYAVTDEEQRAKLMICLGTTDFNWRYKSALREQALSEATAQLDGILSSFATRIGTHDEWLAHSKGRHIELVLNLNTGNVENVMSDARELERVRDSELDYYYKLAQGHCTLYTIRESEDEAEEDDGRKEQIGALVEEVCGLFKQAYEMRLGFAKSVNISGGGVDVVYRKAVRMLTVNYALNEDVFKAFYDIKTNFRKSWEKGDGETFDEAVQRLLVDVDNRAVGRLFVGIYCKLEGPSETCIITRTCGEYGRYEPKEVLTELYDFLIALGYDASAEELELLNGTHELYAQIVALQGDTT